MQLKRLYKKNEDGRLVDADGRVLKKITVEERRGSFLQEVNKMVDDDGVVRTPVVVGVNVNRTSKMQKFTPSLIAKATQQGWATLGDGAFTVHAANLDSPLVYQIVRTPGYYCAHCNVELDDEETSRNHVIDLHAEDDSPDKNNPSGYEHAKYYLCELKGENVDG